MAHFGVRLALACMSAMAISARAGTPPSAMNMASGASSSLPGANNEEYLKRTSWGPELAAALKAPTAFVTAQDPYKRVVNKVLPGIGIWESQQPIRHFRLCERLEHCTVAVCEQFATDKIRILKERRIEIWDNLGAIVHLGR
eukprot:jgi/Botrbrau1/8322/Bobra.0081s0011.1